jgi:hypothetical protein
MQRRNWVLAKQSESTVRFSLRKLRGNRTSKKPGAKQERVVDPELLAATLPLQISPGVVDGHEMRQQTKPTQARW